MIHYEAEIKEVGREQILKPSLHSTEKTVEQLVEFWGLNEHDVEWYRLYQVINNIKIEIK